MQNMQQFKRRGMGGSAPVEVLLELKLEFKQAVNNAIKQYKTTRFAIDPETKKPEPLLTFKRGALVHFSLSQYEVYIATRLEGVNTYFLPFNKGTKAGSVGNDVPEDINQYATDYLWNEVLLPGNLSHLAFTATPKTKTLELFGRLPKPAEPPSKTNKPEAYHVYSMRQAIEEGFILDVLKNYTNYKVAYNLAMAIQEADQEVESKKAKVNQWVRLHDYNISQKVQVIVEHFKDNVMSLLNGQAKAMVVTSSRKEAVRYKMGFDRYLQEKVITEPSYQNIHAMVAFSGEVEFSEQGPNTIGLLGEKFTETSMSPNP